MFLFVYFPRPGTWCPTFGYPSWPVMSTGQAVSAASSARRCPLRKSAARVARPSTPADAHNACQAFEPHARL